MPRGSISDEKGIAKIGKERGRGEGGRGGERLHPDLTFVLVPEHLFWKKHVELSSLFFQAR